MVVSDLGKWFLLIILGFVASQSSIADDIAVKEFVAGTVISSAEVNSNFDILAKESNENDARLTSLEDAGQNPYATSREHVFAGYTSTMFSLENYGNVRNYYTTSLHCKQEFGDSSSILTSRLIENLILSGSTFTPPTEDVALILFNSGNTIITHQGSSSTTRNDLVNQVWETPHREYGYGIVTPEGNITWDRGPNDRTYGTSIPIIIGCMTLQ